MHPMRRGGGGGDAGLLETKAKPHPSVHPSPSQSPGPTNKTCDAILLWYAVSSCSLRARACSSRCRAARIRRRSAFWRVEGLESETGVVAPDAHGGLTGGVSGRSPSLSSGLRSSGARRGGPCERLMTCGARVNFGETLVLCEAQQAYAAPPRNGNGT